MKEKYSLKDIKQTLQSELNDIKTSLTTKGYICEGDFPSINHMIWYKNETTLIEFLENETNLKIECSYDEHTASLVLYDCKKYTYETAKSIPRQMYT